MTRRILDLSSGGRNIWFDNMDTVVFIDIRSSMRPDIVADSRMLPFRDNAGFDLVVFDPPHTTFGPNSQMAQRYGSFKAADIRELVASTATEAARVANPNALMAFKWSNHGHQEFVKIMSLMVDWKPLFGHIVSMRTRHVSTTKWIMLRSRKTE